MVCGCVRDYKHIYIFEEKKMFDDLTELLIISEYILYKDKNVHDEKEGGMLIGVNIWL